MKKTKKEIMSDNQIQEHQPKRNKNVSGNISEDISENISKNKNISGGDSWPGNG